MALFKAYRGNSSSFNTTSVPLTDGYVYLTPDNGKFYVDAPVNNTLTRILINPDEVFWCTSSTTYAQITAALSSNKLPVYRTGDQVYVYSKKVTSAYDQQLGYFFHSIESTASGTLSSDSVTVNEIHCSESGWSTPRQIELVVSKNGTTPTFYKCTYGATTATNIENAVNANQIPVCEYSGRPYFYAGHVANTGYLFSTVVSVPMTNSVSTYINWLMCADTKTWTNGSVSINSFMPLSGGTMTGSIAMGDNKITGLGAPTANGDAATKQYVDEATPIIPAGAVDATSTSTAFTATVPGITELKTGVMMWLKNGVVTSAAGFTLNINNLGAKPVYRGMAAATTAETTIFNINYTMAFIYNETRVEGGCWETMYYNSNTTYSPATLGMGYATCSTAEATAAKTATLSSFKLVTGGIVTVKFTNAVPANATLSINSTTAKNIYFRGAKITAGVIKAGDIATFVYSSQYHLIAIDRWQNDISTHVADTTAHITAAERTAWNAKGDEVTTNKVTSLSSSSTDTQYPSAKCVYDMIGDVESVLTTLLEGGGVSLISFQIANSVGSSTYTTYQAEEGMTWGEWLTSEYRTANFYDRNGVVAIGTLPNIEYVQYNGTTVTTSNVIVSNYNYTLSSTS